MTSLHTGADLNEAQHLTAYRLAELDLGEPVTEDTWKTRLTDDHREKYLAEAGRYLRISALLDQPGPTAHTITYYSVSAGPGDILITTSFVGGGETRVLGNGRAAHVWTDRAAAAEEYRHRRALADSLGLSDAFDRQTTLVAVIVDTVTHPPVTLSTPARREQFDDDEPPF
ncbi:hypothetical protein ACWDUL_21175 [Nocardia niigatensis]